jgi:hypothetical protein
MDFHLKKKRRLTKTNYFLSCATILASTALIAGAAFYVHRKPNNPEPETALMLQYSKCNKYIHQYSK